MAQLIKLKDYVSRYEWSPYHYPSQYIRLKRDNWDKLREQWKSEAAKSLIEMESEDIDINTSSKWNPFKRKNKETIGPPPDFNERADNRLPREEKQLIQYFLDELFPFQLKWATSTLSQVSYTDNSYYTDQTLKYFLQRFPDIYLVMYYPIFNIKKAPVDGEIILISPVGIEIIKLMEEEPSAIIVSSDERTWSIERSTTVEKRISPLIALKRTEAIIKSILSNVEINLPITKTVLSRTNQIIHTTEPYNTNIVGLLEHDEWFDNKRQLSSPLKSEQLKAMDTLLNFCQTTSIQRPEWEEDSPDSFMFKEKN